MTTATIEQQPTGALALANNQQDWTPRQKAALSQLGLDDVPAADLQVFLHQSQRTRLDPFARQIYMIGRWDGRAQRKKFTIQAAIDGLRIVAERHGQYGGQEGPFWCGTDGKWTDVWVSDKPPIAARVGVIRKDWTKTCFAVAKFAEYAATDRDGKLERMWATKSCVMIAKCAEALALRKAFPNDLSGIYTSDEMAQADNPQQRMVIDQPEDLVPAPAEAEPARDWAAEITACAGNREKLSALWKAAPQGSKVRDLIAAAASKTAAAKSPAGSEPAGQPPEADVVVEGVVVPDLPKTPAQFTDQAVKELVLAGGADAVEAYVSVIAKTPRPARMDVSGLLSPEVAAELGADRGEKLPLADFAALVLAYVESNGYSVANGVALAAEQLAGGVGR